VNGRRGIGNRVSKIVFGRTVFIAKFNELCTGQFETPVVPVALTLLDKNLVRHSRGVGQLLDLGIIGSSHESGSCKSQR